MSEPAVAVAMSGGVDSSVAAALLHENGFRVLGITMEPWLADKEKDVEDARKVARILGIEHRVVSLRKAFRENVIDYFISEYRKGRTPNPCAVCNPLIKFGELFKIARDCGAATLATGHYAIVSRDSEHGRMLLKRARMHAKDQSYFLSQLSQEALEHTVFPLGDCSKDEIRKQASRFGLPVDEKSESQEACFVPEGKVAEFIEEVSGIRSEPGDILNDRGEVLGRHRGITAYTIGQRKGLGIALGRPLYVNCIDAAANTIIVSDEEALYTTRFLVSGANWISIPNLTERERVRVRIRYKHGAAPAQILPRSGGRVEVCFEKSQRAVTPGQLAVFYDNDLVVGSAWIDEILD